MQNIVFLFIYCFIWFLCVGICSQGQDKCSCASHNTAKWHIFTLKSMRPLYRTGYECPPILWFFLKYPLLLIKSCNNDGWNKNGWDFTWPFCLFNHAIMMGGIKMDGILHGPRYSWYLPDFMIMKYMDLSTPCISTTPMAWTHCCHVICPLRSAFYVYKNDFVKNSFLLQDLDGQKLQKSPFSPSFRDLFALRIHNGQYYSCGSYFKLYILQFGHVSQ